MQYIYAQNQFIGQDTRFISADDRAFRFGDGVFDTALVVDGRPYDLASHIDRLKAGLAFFRIALDLKGIETICTELIAKNKLHTGYVRMVVSRGEGKAAVGYLPSSTEPYLVVQTAEAPFPIYKPLSLVVSPHAASIHHPCKVMSAMLYTLSMLEAREAACDNALILDAHGHICETASGNIFWLKDGVLHTPELSLPLVPGTLRKKILSLANMPVNEGRFTLADITMADEIFMTNVAYLVTPVISISPLAYEAKDDAQARRLRALVEADIRQETQARR